MIHGSRLQVYLPVNTNRERLAARRVVTHLYNLYGGVTHSALTGRTFRGYWFNTEHSTLYQDEIAIVWVDVRTDADSSDLAGRVHQLRCFAAEQYARFGSGQLEIWTTVERLGIPS